MEERFVFSKLVVVVLFTPHSRRQLHPSDIVRQEMVPDHHKSSISSADTVTQLTSLTTIYLQGSHLQLPLGLQLRQSALSHRPQLRLAAGLRPPGHLPGGHPGAPHSGRHPPPPPPPGEAGPQDWRQVTVTLPLIVLLPSSLL